jgi:hypothetical protein
MKDEGRMTNGQNGAAGSLAVAHRGFLRGERDFRLMRKLPKKFDCGN